MPTDRPCMNPRSVLFPVATPARAATADAACNKSNPLTLAIVVAELRLLNVVCKRTGEGRELRVNFRNGGEATAAYTDDLADALGTGRAMAAWRDRRGEVRS